MIDPAEPLPMNDPQRTHFEVVLSSLENALLRIEELARGAAADQRVLSTLAPDLPPGFAARAGPPIESVRATVRDLTAAMRLESRSTSSFRTVRALLTSQIVQLEDSEAKRLRGYGPVDPRLAAALNPALESMRADLGAIREALEHP